MANVLEELTRAGVSIWLDDLSRNRITSGSLVNYIEKYSVKGVTTNPSIFQNAISQGSESYRDQIRDCAQRGLTPDETIRLITTDDVRSACDVFTGVFEQTQGIDGRVSIEVDPRLAHDTDGTINAAKDLWALVNRKNLFIKIPATDAGLPAITEVIACGISVNVTLIFSVDRYRQVIDAYISGLQRAFAAGVNLSTIQSVASFFISRVDSSVDSALNAIGSEMALQLRGATAIANARLAWEVHLETLNSPQWSSLVGAQPQRPLWASTGVKDPQYPDTRYVIDLVAPGCVNTMPENTLKAVAEHGVFLGDTVSAKASDSAETFAQLATLGVNVPEILQQLEVEGVQKFSSSWMELLAVVDAALKESPQ